MSNAPALAADARRERRRILGLSIPAATIITVIVFLPSIWLFGLSFVEGEAFSLAHYQRMIDSSAYFKIFRQTFEISIVVTVLCVLLGYPLAYLISQLPRRAAGLCLVLVFIPFWTSLLVRTYAWLVLLQRKGLINSWLLDLGVIDTPIRLVHNTTGTVIGMLHIMLPFLILPTYNALKSIDRNYLLAAANLGASPVRAFWTVFFPLSLPGVIAGSLLVFILCLGFYVTPALLGGGKVTMVSMQIQQNAALYFDWGAASALGVVLLAVTLLLFLVIGRALPVDRLMGAR
jgi:putative spermidine/putrescine transport system permease protein/spermidine/putrescine transport system permease protein